MLIPKVGKLKEFVVVHHEGTNTNWRMHESDLPKLGTPQKVLVYAEKNSAYYPPDEKYPDGRYLAQTRIYVGSYIQKI